MPTTWTAVLLHQPGIIVTRWLASLKATIEMVPAVSGLAPCSTWTTAATRWISGRGATTHAPASCTTSRRAARNQSLRSDIREAARRDIEPCRWREQWMDRVASASKIVRSWDHQSRQGVPSAADCSTVWARRMSAMAGGLDKSY